MRPPLPSSMRAVVVTHPGPPEVMQIGHIALPTLKAGEVLVQVDCAGVNRPDCLQRAGLYAPPADASPILGLEVAGTVVDTADADGPWRMGDRVCALVPGGGYAEYCATPAAYCLPIPASLGMAEAASLPETFFTVWNNVFDRARLAAGETILVHGGSSGIGITAIQLAKRFGAQVFVTVGNEAKARACRALGATAAIVYREVDFVAEIERLTSGRGVDVILDMVGGDYFARNVRCLAADGRLAVIALIRGSRIELDARALLTKRLTLTGSTLRASPFQRKAALASALATHVWPLLEAGEIRPVVHRTFPLAEVGAAHRLMESSAHIGKLVLEVAASNEHGNEALT